MFRKTSAPGCRKKWKDERQARSASSNRDEDFLAGDRRPRWPPANRTRSKAARPASKSTTLATQLKSFEAALAKLAESDDSAIGATVNRRLAAVRKLQQSTKRLAAKERTRGGIAASTARSRWISIGCPKIPLELNGKLENAGAQLAGLPDDILDIWQTK